MARCLPLRSDCLSLPCKAAARALLLVAACALSLQTAAAQHASTSARPASSPEIVSSPAPPYPPAAVAALASGEVKVDVVIDKEGVVTRARATSGHPLLRPASEASARYWRFAPASGEAAERTAQISFAYRFILDTGAPFSYEVEPVHITPYKLEIRRAVPPPDCHKRRTRRG